MGRAPEHEGIEERGIVFSPYERFRRVFLIVCAIVIASVFWGFAAAFFALSVLGFSRHNAQFFFGFPAGGLAGLAMIVFRSEFVRSLDARRRVVVFCKLKEKSEED